MIKVINQGYISELGKRANNEDNCAYISGSTFVVCDGVGGAEKGEIASEIISKYFVEAFRVNPMVDANEVLKNAEAKMSDYINDNPDAMGMATTLTFTQVRNDGIYVAWVGDSRIYQFRKGEIVFRTTDHSWVNDALKAGIISKEEAINHPKSNIITRAVQGNHKSTSADTVLLTDIKKGDLFFQCSDGVLETWSDEDLKALFAYSNDPSEILEKMKKECEQNSKDNFTAIVYKIDDVSLINKNFNSDNYVEAIPIDRSKDLSDKPSLFGLMKFKIVKVPFFLWMLVLISIIIFFKFFNEPEKSKSTNKPKVEKQNDVINSKNKKTPLNSSTNDTEKKNNVDNNVDNNVGNNNDNNNVDDDENNPLNKGYSLVDPNKHLKAQIKENENNLKNNTKLSNSDKENLKKKVEKLKQELNKISCDSTNYKGKIYYKKK